MKKRCWPSFIRGTTREDATKLVLSQTDHKMLTRRKHTLIKYHMESPQNFEVPEPLYIYIRAAALILEQKLKTNPNDEVLSYRLSLREKYIHTLAKIHKENGHLPSDWEYDSESASIYVPFCPPVAFKKKPKKIPLNPHFESASLLSENDNALWLDFKNKSRDIPTHKGLPFPADENIKTELHKDDKFVSFIRDFAVDVFNKSYQMYFDKDKNSNISRAKVTKCKYIKVKPCYLFYMTIEAYEQGKLGVYEIELRCDLEDGKIVLDSFRLQDPGKRKRVMTRSISKTVTGKRTSAITSLGPIYETFTDDLTDPQDYYGFSGMTCRTVGGYDYYNPCGWNSFCSIC